MFHLYLFVFHIPAYFTSVHVLGYLGPFLFSMVKYEILFGSTLLLVLRREPFSLVTYYEQQSYHFILQLEISLCTKKLRLKTANIASLKSHPARALSFQLVVCKPLRVGSG